MVKVTRGLANDDLPSLIPILVFFKVYAEELKGGNEVVQLTFRATNLDKKVQKCSIMLFQ